MSTTANEPTASALNEQIISKLPLPVFVLDRAGLIISANGMAKSRFPGFEKSGRPVSENYATRFDSLFSTGNSSLMADVFAAASTGRITMRYLGEGDLAERLHFSVTPLQQQAKQVGHFLICQQLGSKIAKEFTQLRQRVQHSDLAAAREKHNRKKLEQNNRRLTDFSAVAAHDLQAPLRQISTLLAFVDADYGEVLPGDARDLIKTAEKSAARMQDLVADLLRHAKTTSASADVHLINLSEAISHVWEGLVPKTAEVDATIESVSNEIEIEADPVLFRQLIENLIGNALKYYSSDRAPKIRVSTRKIGPFGREISFSDNGQGFEAKYEEEIFQPFNRLHPSSAIEGSGIGLATCKSICDLHGWELSCEGKPEVGATFTVRLPG